MMQPRCHWQNAHVSRAWGDPCSHRMDHRNYRTRREGHPRLIGQQQVFSTASVDYQTLYDHHSSESRRTWPSIDEDERAFSQWLHVSLLMLAPKNGGDWVLTALALAAPHLDSCSLYVGGGWAISILILEVTQICARPRRMHDSGGGASFPLTEMILTCELALNLFNLVCPPWVIFLSRRHRRPHLLRRKRILNNDNTERQVTTFFK